ncbi:MAG TPA: ATP-dependent helicase C-terminal domain-containing protein, partial [Steroidobacteraceae bacterium]
LTWLEPFLEGATRRSQLGRVPLLQALAAHVGYERQRRLDELAPTHVGLPTGTRARIDYLSDNAPIASMRMQEVFGLAATPRIGGGTVPVTFELLSPARRPLQVTRDLASFWKNAYLDVRKDMRGRYPRHYWPENPLEAEPTRRVKPRA